MISQTSPSLLEIIEAHIVDLHRLDNTDNRKTHIQSNIYEADPKLNPDHMGAFVTACHDAALLKSLFTFIDSGPDSPLASSFIGLLVGSGCLPASTGGLEQYRAYRANTWASHDIDNSDRAECRFGTGSAMSLGVL